MMANYRLIFALLASAAFAAAAVTGLKAQAKPPVYFVIDISEMLDAPPSAPRGVRSTIRRSTFAERDD